MTYVTDKIKPFTFATGNYPAGSEDWSGQPRQVVLTDAEKLAGLVPNTPVGADIQNGMHAEHYAAQSVQAIGAMKTWARSATIGTGEHYKFLVATNGHTSHIQKAVVGFLDDTVDYKLARSYGGGHFEDPIFDGSPTNAATCAAGASIGGSLVFAVAGGGVVRVIPAVGTGAPTDYDFFSDIPTAVHYADFCSRYLVASSTGFIFEGMTPGAGASSFVATSIQAASIGVAGGEFADDGAANIVFACKCIIAGVNRFRIFWSGNNGASWSVAHVAGAGITGLNVVWSEVSGCFVALNSDGAIYTSATGSGFSLLRTTAITAAAGASLRHGTLACQGACIAKGFAPFVYGSTNTGLVYTFDLGAGWRNMTLGVRFGVVGDDVQALLGANGRFYLASNFAVYTSGCVLAEPTDY